VKHTNTSYFTMVALDVHGKPTPVPQYQPTNENEQRRWEEAKIRRANLVKANQ
jgi:acyl-CoA hydrolase